MNKLNIGLGPTKISKLATKCLAQLCLEFNVPYNQIDILNLSQDSLRDQMIDVFAHPLDIFPLNYPDDIVIAGLSPRQEIRALAIVNSEDLSFHSIADLTQDYKIFVPSEGEHSMKTQLLAYYPKLLFVKSKEESDLSIAWSPFPTHSSNGVFLDPREIIPPAGKGTTAFICLRSNIKTRRILQDLHDRTTAYCTNVERLFAKNLATNKIDVLGAHSVRDKMGNYHFYACIKSQENQLLKINHSQSTFLNLAENAILKYNNEISHF